MIDFVRHTCLKHIAVVTMSVPDWSKDVSSPLDAQEVSEDEYTQLNLTGRHENRGKITRF